ncbi:excisionase [Hydrogenophaga sp.]|uniref:excisionase n=1 Tax=Hydrogenophaga sp. TaxID=1904254 RepID=UPI00391A4F77
MSHDFNHSVDRWVLVNVLSEYTGYSDDAVRAKIRRGDWVCGPHWRKAPDGRIVFNLTRIQAWMAGS